MEDAADDDEEVSVLAYPAAVEAGVHHQRRREAEVRERTARDLKYRESRETLPRVTTTMTTTKMREERQREGDATSVAGDTVHPAVADRRDAEVVGRRDGEEGVAEDNDDDEEAVVRKDDEESVVRKDEEERRDEAARQVEDRKGKTVAKEDRLSCGSSEDSDQIG